LPADTAPPDTAISHRGLIYPWARQVPDQGKVMEVGQGVGWARLSVPGSLGHVNVWIVEDGAGVALVDTGLNLPATRAAWEMLIAGPLAGRRITRLFCTHFHPDHTGLAGWLAERFGVALWMSRTEWLMARMLILDARDSPPPEAIAFWRSAGWSDDRIARVSAAGWRRFGRIVSPLPTSYVRMTEGDAIPIGSGVWQVIVGGGHSPEHVCLWNRDANLLIAGDQVLPRISSNVSVSLHEPAGNPLRDWLASIDRLMALPEDVLVLPSHGEPFTGLHVRLAALRDGHHAQLDALARFIGEPRRVVDCFPSLFRRTIGDEDLSLATGEALAHLRWLEEEGRAIADLRDGVLYYRAVQGGGWAFAATGAARQVP
jgi:glyoxylase-like metal-dependent hydrolase (beta-lactamase superfamily II)